MNVGLDSATSTLSANKIEDYGLKIPFSITKFFIQFDKGCSAKRLQGEVAEIDGSSNSGTILDSLEYNLEKTPNGVVYGISFSSNEDNLRFKLGATIEIFDRDVQLVYTAKIGEAE